MRTPLFDPNARGEAAIATAFTDLERERVKAEIAEAVRITSAYVAQHGHPFADWLSDFEPEDSDEGVV